MKTSRRILAPIAALCFAWMLLAAPQPANAACSAPCTKAQIATDIATNWPDNTVAAITPALLRSTVLEIVNSYLDIGSAASFTCSTHNFLVSIATLSSYTCAQPVIADISGFGTGVGTALGVNVSTAGAFVVNGGALGIPSSGTLTNATGLPVATGISGLSSGMATYLGSASAANLAATLGGPDKTGTGAVVFATSPTLVTPALGTPTALVLTNATGLPANGGLTGQTTIANGGTGQATAATARASSGLNVDQYTGHGDSIYTILSTDRTVGTNAAFTASRTWTLPAANAVNAGQEIIVADFQGTVTVTNTLVISRAGADTINGGTSVTISTTNGAYLLKSDGTSKWTAQALGTAAAGGVSSVTAGTGLSGGGAGAITVSLSTPVSIANGGTNDTGSAWTTYTPTMTGGCSTWAANGVSYKAIGKTYYISVNLTLTNATGCAGQFTFTLPLGISAHSAASAVLRENTNTGTVYFGWVSLSSPTVMTVGTAANGNPTYANNNLFAGSFVLEAQ